jgi:hypothetical protein
MATEPRQHIATQLNGRGSAHPPEVPSAGSYPAEQNPRDAELAWLRAHERELAKQYAGQWIAVDGSELVAIAPDLLDLLQQASDKGHPHPFVTALPADPEKELYF